MYVLPKGFLAFLDKIWIVHTKYFEMFDNHVWKHTVLKLYINSWNHICNWQDEKKDAKKEQQGVATSGLSLNKKNLLFPDSFNSFLDTKKILIYRLLYQHDVPVNTLHLYLTFFRWYNTEEGPWGAPGEASKEEEMGIHQNQHLHWHHPGQDQAALQYWILNRVSKGRHNIWFYTLHGYFLMQVNRIWYLFNMIIWKAK